jgi:scyllo-inositol 2-dehydrogenase (NADP+)
MDASKRFHVVGVVDRHDDRAKKVAQARGYRRYAQAQTLEQVPWLDEVDAITISTSPDQHYPLARAALRRNLPVLTEKPFAMRVGEGEELVALAAERRVPLAIVHNFQFARSALRLWKDLERGALGAIQSVLAVQAGNPRRRLPVWYDQLPSGLFFDESPHLLYLLSRLAKQPLELVHVYAVPSSSRSATPAIIHAELRGLTEHGVRPFTLRCHFEAPVSEWYLIVFGTKAMATVDVFRDIYVRLENDGGHSARDIVRTSVAATWQHWWQHVPSGLGHLAGTLHYGNDHVFDAFADAIETSTWDPPLIGASSALRILRMQHAIIQGSEACVHARRLESA